MRSSDAPLGSVNVSANEVADESGCVFPYGWERSTSPRRAARARTGTWRGAGQDAGFGRESHRLEGTPRGTRGCRASVSRTRPQPGRRRNDRRRRRWRRGKPSRRARLALGGGVAAHRRHGAGVRRHPEPSSGATARCSVDGRWSESRHPRSDRAPLPHGLGARPAEARSRELSMLRPCWLREARERWAMRRSNSRAGPAPA